MKHILYVCLLLTQVAVAQSGESIQADSLPKKINYKFGLTSEFGINYALSSLPIFASFARSNGVNFSSRRLGVNFTFATGFRLNRFRIQLAQAIQILPFDDTSPPSANGWTARSLGSGHVGGTLGYDVLNNRNRRLYVLGGFGQIGQDYSFYRQSAQSVPFGTIFQANQNSVPSMTIRNQFVEFGIEYAQQEKRRRTASNVLRAGYRMGINKQPWGSDTYTLTNPITERVNQFYVQWAVALSTNWNRGDRPSARKNRP
ncbi:MAG: hypothetical protein EAZ91_19405 [Cytophagales bacterium]|nr:MAG: hypothetical protein EAZ91_19405 [Cytophagales bacterium]